MTRRLAMNLDVNTLNVYTSGGDASTYTTIDCSDGCTAMELAQWDMFQWSQGLASDLPEPVYKIDVQGVSPWDVTVSIKWQVTNNEDTASDSCLLPVEQNEACITEMLTVAG